jgi:hypothetical protein
VCVHNMKGGVFFYLLFFIFLTHIKATTRPSLFLKLSEYTMASFDFEKKWAELKEGIALVIDVCLGLETRKIERAEWATHYKYVVVAILFSTNTANGIELF